MEKLTVQYSTLKSTYLEVLDFTKNYAPWGKSHSSSTRLVEDLELWGDENVFFLMKFHEKFGVDLSTLTYNEHFEEEGPIGLFALLFLLVVFPFSLVQRVLALALKPISMQLSAKIKNFQLLPGENIERKDVTIGDLVVSVLEGEFQERKNTALVLKSTTS